jgi:C_GCAxxG_C_C family probable redox protein
VLLALEEHFGLADPSDGAAAMALNGGVAYSGGTCGAITGAALALGRLAAERTGDRRAAKRNARELTAGVADAIELEFGATDCRTLTGFDLRAPGGHDAFMAAGAWRTDCLRRLELVVERLAPLVDEAAWAAATTTPDEGAAIPAAAIATRDAATPNAAAGPRGGQRPSTRR